MSEVSRLCADRLEERGRRRAAQQQHRRQAQRSFPQQRLPAHRDDHDPERGSGEYIWPATGTRRCHPLSRSQTSTSVHAHPRASPPAAITQRLRERCVCVCVCVQCCLVRMPGSVYSVSVRVSPQVDMRRSVRRRRLLVHHHLHSVETTRSHTQPKPLNATKCNHLCQICRQIHQK